MRKCTGTEPVSSKLSQIEWSPHKKYGHFKCSFCDQIFRKTSRLEKHCDTVHHAMKRNYCSLSGEREHTASAAGLDITNYAGDDLVLMMVNTEEVIQTEVVDTWTVGDMIECQTGDGEKEDPT